MGSIPKVTGFHFGIKVGFSIYFPLLSRGLLGTCLILLFPYFCVWFLGRKKTHTWNRGTIEMRSKKSLPFLQRNR